MIIKSPNLNIKQIADSGQSFRLNQIEEYKFRLIAYGKCIEIHQLDWDKVELKCSMEDYETIWKDYFDLEYDYQSIVEGVIKGDDVFLREAATYGEGIRILKQDPFEMLISFIISQNKNIPSIKCCIERICERYGDPIKCRKDDSVVYYSFPSPEQLSKAKKEELREMKLGYRDDYIMKASQAVMKGEINLTNLIHTSYEEAMLELKKIAGIGDKVANCIALYGLHHIEAFPIDVWIAKVLKEVYQNDFNIQQFNGYAGIVQQYMFYYIRKLNLNK